MLKIYYQKPKHKEPPMDTINKKHEIFNKINNVFSQVTNIDSPESITETINIIKGNMLNIGADILEYWITNIFPNKLDSNILSDDVNFKGYVEKTYLSTLGEIKINRAYYYDSKNKEGVYPIEDKYPFLKDYCLPDMKEIVCFTSCLNPFDLTQEIIEKLAGIRVSTSQTQKITKKIGSKLIDKEEYEIENPPKYTSSKREIDRMVISMDGAMIKTYDDWKEVKSGVIYEIKKRSESLDSVNKSYISKIEDCHSFQKRIKQEARRRHYLDAKELSVIGDGARWIWDLAEKEFPLATQIVDWYHAKQHLCSAITLLYNNKKNKEYDELLKKCSDLLYNGNIEELEKVIKAKIYDNNLIERLDDLAAINTEIEYFIRNKKRMQYSFFKENDWPIGSGIIEAACKQLVQLRLKRNGMKWKREGAHCVLKLRCMYLSGRWDEVKSSINIEKAA
jgi:hypothetical protein